MRPLAGLLPAAAAGTAVALAGLASGNGTVALVGLCALLGLMVKATDQTVELGSMAGRRWIAYPLAGGVIAVTVHLSLTHDPVFGMVAGTAVGLVAAGKVDHPAMWAAALGFFAMMGAVVFVLRAEIAMTSYLLIPLAGVGSYLDEHFHERTAGSGRRTERFFEHRPVLKAVALAGTLAGFAGWQHFAGFMAFDAAYDWTAFVWQE